MLSVLYSSTLLCMVKALSVIHTEEVLDPALVVHNRTNSSAQNTKSAVQAVHPNLMQMAVITKNSNETCNFSSVKVKCNVSFDRIDVRSMNVKSPPAEHALIRVLTSSVNPTDWKHYLMPSEKNPRGIGHDFAGRIASTGLGCDSFFAEDEVWGLGETAFQEFLVHPCANLGKKPANFNFIQAGASGVVVQTGYTGFRWAGAPWNNSPTVLVIGGSSGTGHVGIQLAKAFGAGKVITTCSPKNFNFVRNLGADEVIDYHDKNWWESLEKGSIDIVYDCIAEPGTGNSAYSVLAPDGKFVTLLGEGLATNTTSNPDVQQWSVAGLNTTTEDLDYVKKFAEEGKLNITIDQYRNGLTKENVQALFNISMKGHVVGKLALQIGSPI